MTATILLVENDPQFASTLKDVLKRKGYDSVEASSIREARAKIQHQRGIKAAIVDIRLENDAAPEDWSGLIFARGIADANIPVIILSAYDKSEDIRRAFDVAPGVEPPYAFVSKNSPDWQEELSQALKEVIAARQAQRWRPSGLWMLAAALIILAVALWVSPSWRGALAGILVDLAFLVISYLLTKFLTKPQSP